MNTIWTNSIYNTIKTKSAYRRINNKTAAGSQRESVIQAQGQQFIDLQLSKDKDKQAPKLDNELTKKLKEMKMMQQRLEEEKKSMRLANIDGQLKSGELPSKKDLEFLKKNRPELYEEVMEIKREREDYKKALERCQSKEEAEKLQKMHRDNFFSQIKAINSANIPKEKKLAEIEKVNRKMAGYNAEFEKFKKSNKFKSLPEKEKI